ncbi:DUF3800 domain-containing protein [Paenibacillus alkaliterrae]|uniref:DUF3800 domain-containing protein n=1 Tax=Paenibacillus alkaliterrae TaxID=320909 RepID=UPI001F2BD23C|nr:DUF3800 domain-containing protein [Paenibacillus alkaliterrae]MCF2940123.1 DUF3800 domain-containing protein [Paenibacillus alkaliterrae]
MKIFTDESGDFSLKNSTSPSMVASLICTEDMYEGIKRFMNTMEKRYNGGAEIKGSDLTFEQRLRVCEFLKKNRDHLKATMTIVLPSVVTHEDLNLFRTNQAETFQKNKEWYINAGGKVQKVLEEYDRIAKLAMYQSRLSDEEFLQALLLTQQMERVIKFCIVYFMERKHRRNFKDFIFLFDRKLPNKLSAMEKYILNYVKAFLDGKSKMGMTIPIPNVWKTGHPFIDRYMITMEDGREAFFLNELLKNFEFEDSKNDPGLRMVDIISNTIYQHILNPNNLEIAQCYNTLQYALGYQNKMSQFHIILKKV